MAIYLRLDKSLTQEFPADQQFSDPSISSTHDITLKVLDRFSSASVHSLRV